MAVVLFGAGGDFQNGIGLDPWVHAADNTDAKALSSSFLDSQFGDVMLMGRTAIAAYLIVVALLGPGLCCCTFAKSFEKRSCRRNAAPAAHRHCCHKHGPRSEHRLPKAPAGDSSPCPCNDHRNTPVALLSCDVETAKLIKSGLVVDQLSVASWLFPGEIQPALQAGASTTDLASGDAFSTGEDILRALSVLRC